MTYKNKTGMNTGNSPIDPANASRQLKPSKSTIAKLLDYTHMPSLWTPKAETLVSTDGLKGQLDEKCFLIDGKTSGAEVNPKKLGVASVGAVKDGNIDFIVVRHGLEIGGETYDLYGVFDGAGKPKADGSEAKPHELRSISKIVAERITENLASSRNTPISALRYAIDEVNKAVCNSSLKKSWSSTATIALVNPKRRNGVLLNMGHSRASFVSKKQAESLTEDSYSRLLGIPKSEGTVTELDFHDRGFLLFTTTGVHEHLKKEEMQSIVLGSKKDLNAAAGMLVSVARRNVPPGGRMGDASVVVVRVR